MADSPRTPGIVRYAHTATGWAGQHFTVIAAAFLAATVVALAWQHRPRRKRRTSPAAVKLTDRIRPIVKHGDDVRRFIEWPRDVHAVGAPITIRYPARYHPSTSDVGKIGALIAGHVGGEWTAEDRPLDDRLMFTRNAPPFAWPTQLSYGDLTDGGRDVVPLGVREGGDPFVWEWSVPQYAHILLGGQSGSGKSNATRLLITGVVQRGGTVDILDAKSGEDFEDFAGNPSIRVRTEPEDMVAAIADFKAEYGRRKMTRGAVRDALPRRVLLIDETAEVKVVLAAKLGQQVLKQYVADLQSLTALVRSSRLHMIISTQKPTAKALTGEATSGAALRDLLGYVIGLGRLSESSSKMLFDDARPPAVDERNSGRGVVSEGGAFTMVQTAKLDLSEAVRLAVGPGRFLGTAAPVVLTKDVGSRPRAYAHVGPAANMPTSLPTPATTVPSGPRYTFSCSRCAAPVETSMAPGANGARCPCGWKGRVPRNAGQL